MMLTSNTSRNAAMETLNLVSRRPVNGYANGTEYQSETNGFDNSEIARSVIGNTTALNNQRVINLPPVSAPMSQRSLELARNNSQEKLLLDTKSKILVSTYVAVVLLLVLGIALAIGSMNVLGTEIEILKSDIATKIAAVTVLEEAVAAMQDDLVIAEIAAGELGLSNPNANNTMYYSAPKTRAAQNYNVERNWFDKLCDWLGGIVGGN